MRSASMVLALAVGLPLLLNGCTSADTSMFVRNDTDQAWLVRVVRWPNSPETWVARVEPGADTFAVSWDGGRDVPVTVLSPDCTPVGVFRVDEGDEFVVDEVPGLTAHLEGRIFLGSRTTTPGIDDTEDCGGFLVH